MTDAATPFSALEKVVTIMGGQSALARHCGVTQAAVWKWINGTGQLPAEYVLSVEACTGVSRHDLRPDIYPKNHPPAHRFCGVARRAGRVSFKNQSILNGVGA